MKLIKFLIPLCLFIPMAAPLQAGNNDIINNEPLLLQYLNQSVFPIDTSAQAIVLYEKGTSFIADGYLERKIERVVKILGKDAIRDFATINIPKGKYSAVTKIKGITYNLENGTLNQQDITRSDILNDAIDKNVMVAKFNLPSVKEGSVIYYTYTTTSPGWLFIPDWTFQSKYPTLESVYQINVPSYIGYLPIERVNVALTRVDKEKEVESCRNCVFQGAQGGRQTDHIWIRNNIEAFKKEPHMSSPDNYMERVKIHISSFKGERYDVAIYNNWFQISQKFYFENEEFCGQVFAANRFLEPKVTELTKGKADELAKARAIYAFVRDSIKSREPVKGNKVSQNIKEVLNKREGSTDGVNLLLTAMLRRAGFEAEPVLLATRSQERLNELYPDPDNINYLVSRINIKNQDYFLDASEQLPFGVLLPECYNGYCRVVNEKGGSTSLDPNSLKDKTTVMVSLSPKTGNKLQLKVDEQLGSVIALHYRKEWKKDTSAVLRMIRKELAESTLKTTLDKYEISNIDNPDLPLSLHYEASVDFEQSAGTIYFDPYFFKFFDKNPFHAATRKYAIEMDYLQDISYIFRFQLPKDYEVDDYPKSASFKFTDDELMSVKNQIQYTREDNSFQLNYKFNTKTTTFSPEFYDDLRAFYGRIIEDQHKKIVIKKTGS